MKSGNGVARTMVGRQTSRLDPVGEGDHRRAAIAARAFRQLGCCGAKRAATDEDCGGRVRFASTVVAVVLGFMIKAHSDRIK